MTGTYRQPTKRQVARAIAETYQLTRQTPREKAAARVDRAKHAFTVAAEAAQRNEVGAAGLADVALAELNRARAALSAIDEQNAA